jgi:predicted dinucleotide-binding enzyme
MQRELFGEWTRRALLRALSLTAAAGLLGVAPGTAPTASAQGAEGASSASGAPLKIGIIGTGRIGSALARHWVRAGHEVLMSSRHPDELKPLAEELGPKARVGMPREAAAFGDVVLVSVPYSAMPQIGRDYAAELEGKIVLDTSNPVERRDGAMAAEALEKGSGVASAEYLAGTRIVRAFNCIPAASLANEGNRDPERYAIPLAGDDAEALAVAKRLVDEAGFDSVVVGNLESARRFDLGQPLASRLMTAAELQRAVDD